MFSPIYIAPSFRNIPSTQTHPRSSSLTQPRVNKPNTSITSSLLLFFTVLVTATAVSASVAPPARRSRFLLVSGTAYPPLPTYDCSKKSAEACLAPGSLGPTCCGGQCVDTVANDEHCGRCNKACKHGRTCCGGQCVDLLSDKKNCGSCSNHCNNGFCDYAE